jgi:glycyl-tRNA synthetase beta chain
MPQLLLELFSEEIPARMAARAEADLERLLMDKLSAAGLLPEGVKAFSTPRRLSAVVEGLPSATPDVREERKGPRVGAPDKAVEGFLKSAGLASLDQAQVQKDPKGDFYVALIEKAGRATADVIAEIVPQIVRAFPWPKSMRSADADLYWVRPLQRIVCCFDGEPVAFDLPGVAVGNVTSGHRFHAPKPFAVRRLDDYEAGLKKTKVILRRDERKAMILADARTACQAQGLELVEDPGLLDEVAGLVEWPVVLIGEMDPNFLSLPSEVIRLTMRTHQKYFAVRDPATGMLAAKFVTVANIAASDGGTAIVAGNRRVLSARLNDARFFWDKDGQTPLFTKERREKLKQIVFHAKLGSVWDKVERVKALAQELAPAVGADPALVARAADLMKMDLVTETVGEFPELQGQIGRQLAEGKEHPSVAAAIEDHYRPLGPNDRVPTDPVAITLALADKLDSLAGFWAIDEKPTGSSDAFGLRRAALGLVRIVLENGVRFGFGRFPIWFCFAHIYGQLSSLEDVVFEGRLEALKQEVPGLGKYLDALIGAMADLGRKELDKTRLQGFEQTPLYRRTEQDISSLFFFIADRLKVQLRDQGKRHDLVDAVFALGDDDLVRIVARVEALAAFLKTEDGKNLLAGHKRATNILAAEDKKGQGAAADWAFDRGALKEPAEIALAKALDHAEAAVNTAVEKEDFAAAMKALSALRAPVDQFFTDVLVNAEDPLLRRNRLMLLSRIGGVCRAVADFSKIEG